MAHVGKYYRLAFRRDLNIAQTTNRAGHAHEYFVSMGVLGGALGANVASRTYRCLADQQRVSNSAIWQSGEFFFSHYRYRIRLTVSFDPATVTARMYMSVFDATLGEIYRQRNDWVRNGGAYWNYAVPSPPELWHPPDITWGPFVPSSGALAIDWAGNITNAPPSPDPPHL